MSKIQLYQRLAQQADALMAEETHLIANLANLSALLFMELEDINWVGFYLYENNELVLVHINHHGDHLITSMEITQ
ncbi:protein of unknown function, might be GAF domain-containing protein A [Moritella yayanosii]|uniref:GAF domain-containing protein n=1 Tax=Moritella yayanosii TaxID=69539 RepID=A0A330LSF1_9GAMM|nr:protein of unknown function, might be GAF domain-containing protein A [Moritella yayanosii]